MAGNARMLEKCKQNKVQYESGVRVGRYLYELILNTHFVADPQITPLQNMSTTRKKKDFTRDEQELVNNGIGLHNLGQLDLVFLHKLVFHLCDLENKTPVLQSDLQSLKDHRNYIAHNPNITDITDMFIWRKMEELRSLFQKILNGVKDFYKIDVDGHIRKINEDLDAILKGISVEVTDLTVGLFWQELQVVGRCPFKVKIEIRDYSPEDIPDLVPVLQAIGQDEHTKVTFLVNKAYFENANLEFYDSKKYLTPLLGENSKCKLVWYRGNLCNEMIALLPASLKQLYVRMTMDQVEHLKARLPELIELWSLGLYLDFTKTETSFGFDTIDLSTLPQLGYKGKQLGLRFCGSIATDNITVVVAIIKGLTKDHQCDTLEFYRTHLNTGEEIEELLQALNNAGVHVTTWLKLQNQESMKDLELEAHLNDLGKTLNIKTFKFLNPWLN